MKRFSRRALLRSAAATGGAAVIGGIGYGIWNHEGNKQWAQEIDRTYRIADTKLSDQQLIAREIVRYATMAPNSHNTQPWRFLVKPNVIEIHPDFRRRCPVVDPDDHHLFASLGCAAENAIHAAAAFGQAGEVVFDEATESVRIELSKRANTGNPTLSPSRESNLFRAIPERQSTRAPFDGTRLSSEELNLHAEAGTSPDMRVILVTDPKRLEEMTQLIVASNKLQLNDPAFKSELIHWMRFSHIEAAEKCDGLFGKSSGNPVVPTWIGKRIIDSVFNVETETKKYLQQLKTSAGLAIFVGAHATKRNWLEVGRCFERFALQATAMDVLHSHVNQPVEVPMMRAQLTKLLQLGDARPDLVIRFGRGKQLPKSLRRPVDAVVEFL